MNRRAICILGVLAWSCFGLQAQELLSNRRANHRPVIATSCTSIISSNTGTYDNASEFGFNADTRCIYFPFTNVAGGTICGVEFSLRTDTTPNFDIDAGVFSTITGTNPVDLQGTWSAPIAASTLTASLITNTFTWSSGATLDATTYIMVLRCSSFTAGSSVRVALHNPYYAGILSFSQTNLVQTAIGNRRPYFRLKAQ